MKKKKREKRKGKKYMILFFILAILGGIGTYGYLYYQSATGLDIEINNVEIVSIDASIFSGTADINFRLYGTVTSGNAIKISIDSATFFVKLESIYLGSGYVDPFTADNDGEPILIHFNGKDLGSDAAFELASLLLGNSKTLHITITSITVYGYTINTEISLDQTITRDDIL